MLTSLEVASALAAEEGREVVERGYAAFKTNVVVPGQDPQVLMPGFNEPVKWMRS